MFLYRFSPPYKEAPTFVPQPKVPNSLSSVMYYFTGVPREKAQRMLEHHPVGTYLLRDCESLCGNYTLTFK